METEFLKDPLPYPALQDPDIRALAFKFLITRSQEPQFRVSSFLNVDRNHIYDYTGNFLAGNFQERLEDFAPDDG